MPSTTRFGATIPILAAALAAAPASAADESAQFWIFGGATAPVTDDVTFSALAFQRFRDESHGGDAQVLRGSIDWKLDPVLTLGGGLTYVQTPSSHQWRTHQQVLLTFDALSFRTQLEEAYKPDAARPQLRLRERVQASLKLDPKDKLLLSGELLYLLQSETPGEDARVDSWRVAAQVQRKLSDHWDGTLGYMMILTPNSDRENQIAHAPQVGMIYRY
ncbi:DUF2490 domain-containing protein [Altererythrobacter sp. Z27]|uniref:DUF2490 domain-containing protein n=1 Tax=Altererythrobacter sp. Z27 TaxID=3461147 RepID=UPI00404503DC